MLHYTRGSRFNNILVDLRVGGRCPAPSLIPDPRVVGIYGMTCKTSRDEINEKFSKFGHIEKNFMVMNRVDKHNPIFKGYAYLTFKDKEEATRAIKEMNGGRIQGRQITVDYASSKPHWERPEEEKLKGDKNKEKYGGSINKKDQFGRDCDRRNKKNMEVR